MRAPRWTVPALVLALTVVQLLVATFARDLPQFAGKAFGARLVFYPVMMLFVPGVWFAVHRGSRPAPWGGFSLVMLPFLVDVSGNTLDLYDRVVWWDDLLHFGNWCLLTLGLGVVLRLADVRPRWVRAVTAVGGGALLALLWEVGEWWTFIRHGTELDTAYEDTLGDMVLGTTGSAVALVVLVALSRRSSSGTRP
ncbi:hypothetical protein [Kineococcus sp. NPDC059986]|jgi:hypothetical protein|uniref:hypothetical protein n=1 Tax=Kineococcus sp. NPDC059986 TaxID=3155538 RepID=UPI003450DC1C